MKAAEANRYATPEGRRQTQREFVRALRSGAKRIAEKTGAGYQAILKGGHPRRVEEGRLDRLGALY